MKRVPELPGGMKHTKQRELVWEALHRAELPLSAKGISAGLEREGNPVWLSTVYRILEAFTEKGFALKTAVLDGGEALYEPACRGHRHYAVCMSCQKVIPMRSCPLDSGLPGLEEEDFLVVGHRLQMYGYCRRCAKNGGDR